MTTKITLDLYFRMRWQVTYLGKNRFFWRLIGIFVKGQYCPILKSMEVGGERETSNICCLVVITLLPLVLLLSSSTQSSSVRSLRSTSPLPRRYRHRVASTSPCPCPPSARGIIQPTHPRGSVRARVDTGGSVPRPGFVGT